ncbi:MAG: CDP-archaeol synthase [Proteobacteria bacterium]|nr:CDP-archaeol synthase [Pseudomonadota bacterium]
MAAASAGTGVPILQAEAAGAGAGRGDWSDLGPRIASSLVLAIGGVAAAWFGGAWIAGACGAAVAVMSYEWARMSEPEAATQAFMFTFAGALGAVMFASWGLLGYGAAWMAGSALLSATRRRSLAGIVETAGGTLYIGLPCAVFVWLRRQPEGLAIVLVLFTVIWAADIFAYFGGKLIGGPKVSSGLSPNKTWSGIISGVVAGAIGGGACGVVFGAPGGATGIWSLIGAVLAFTGLMGDVFEAFLKRRFGVKDASKIIPGHGGLLDRIDGLMAATLLTGAVVSLWPGVTSLLESRS